jgi:hypothetical protein
VMSAVPPRDLPVRGSAGAAPGARTCRALFPPRRAESAASRPAPRAEPRPEEEPP